MEQSEDSIETYTVTKEPFAASGLHKPLVVEKPWGHEEWVAHNSSYVMKLLYVSKGECLSKQYHEEKMETLRLIRGRCSVLFGHEGDLEREVRRFVMDADDTAALHINPRTIHRFEALEDAVFVEVSTPQVNDVVRLEDRYNRPATYALEQQLK